jgi:hypothetical protein
MIVTYQHPGENGLALNNTFPASDPVSVKQPAPPAADRDRAKT